jgi:DNA-binding NarL/FixJ family response regulator
MKEVSPDTAVLMVSAYSYPSYVLAALRSGAAGYLLKDTPLSEIINAIRMVNSGEAVFDMKATGKILRRLANDGTDRRKTEELQPRELEVLNLAAKGVGNKEIATKLSISERTVQTHLVNVFRKLHVNSRTEAVLYALKEGWLNMDDLPDKEE